MDHIDKIVAQAFKTRVIKPSTSAWERMSDQLNTVPKKSERNWFVITGYAASILLIISLAFFMNTNDENLPAIPNIIVVQPIDTIKEKKRDFKMVTPIQEAIVKNSTNPALKQHKKKTKIKKIAPKFKQPIRVKDTRVVVVDNKINIEKNTVKDVHISKLPIINESKRSRIKIDSEALLYAVTHTDTVVKHYYTKYKVDRAEVLKSVEKQLRKMNLKIDATIMLAEIERTIDEDSFKRNFMRTIKGKVTGLAIAFQNRNN